jgi:hypothetical protein
VKELIETETVEIITKILDQIRQRPNDDAGWKDLLRNHISKKSVCNFYLQLLLVPPHIFDPKSSEGFDLWIEFIYGYNVRIVIGRNVLFATDDGYIGLAPPGACEGDMIAYIDGIDHPMILQWRKKKLGLVLVVGDCCFINDWVTDPITDEDREEGLIDIILA